MATTEALVSRQVLRDKPQQASSRFGIVVVTVLTAIALLVHGYHPYAEDGGVYLPGIIKALHPNLYPTWTGFVTAQTRFSLFAQAMAGLVRLTHLDVMICVFIVYLASIWTTLYAAWKILARCYGKLEACLAGVSILALCLTTPVAGSALILLDPYLTARSFSTPCTLTAIVGALGIISDFKETGRVRWRNIAVCAISLTIAAAMHPLMAAYAAGCVLLLVSSSIVNLHARTLALGLVALFSVSVAALLYYLAPAQPDGYAQVAQTRDYWFLSRWHWYEVFGLFGPLLVLFAIVRKRMGENEPTRCIAQMGIAGGIIGLLVAALFARESCRTYMVAMLQPLRIFLIVYVVMILLAGAEIGSRWLKRIRWRWSLLYLALGSLMFFVQLETFPNSRHLEFPWSDPHNGWEQGFLWIRDNTPHDALFAMDASYINGGAEDTQNFRAIAQRSTLPDYTKDGGIAAIEPDLTAGWRYGENIQTGLASDSDAQRQLKLAAAQIRWLVLPRSAATGFSCPYQNESMKVCVIPRQQNLLRANAPASTGSTPRSQLTQQKSAVRSTPNGRHAIRAASLAERTPGQE